MAALTTPNSRERLAERIARRDAGFTHQSQPNQFLESASVVEVAVADAATNATNAKVSYSGNWAGAVLSAKNVRLHPLVSASKLEDVADPLLLIVCRLSTRP